MTMEILDGRRKVSCGYKVGRCASSTGQSAFSIMTDPPEKIS
ncbi:MAG: hypothetical protein WAK69_14825 [Rhodoplanes sp.]